MEQSSVILEEVVNEVKENPFSNEEYIAMIEGA